MHGGMNWTLSSSLGLCLRWSFPSGSDCKVSARNAGDPGLIPWRRKMATHSRTLAWEIPWTEEPEWVAKSRIQLSDFTFTLLKVRAGRKGWVIFVEKAGLACMDRLSSSLTFQQSSSLSQLPSFPEGKVRPAEKRHWLLISSLVAHPPADTDGARGGALGEVMRWDLWAEKKQNLLPWIIDFPVEWRWIHV